MEWTFLEERETQGTDNYLLGHWEYNSKHQPLVYIDGSAQRTEYTYNSSGQVLTVKCFLKGADDGPKDELSNSLRLFTRRKPRNWNSN